MCCFLSDQANCNARNIEIPKLMESKERVGGKNQQLKNVGHRTSKSDRYRGRAAIIGIAYSRCEGYAWVVWVLS